jgi:hypothetical protein
MLGSDLYGAYLEGRVSRRFLKSLFLTHLEDPGSARKAYFDLAHKVRSGKKRARGVGRA